MLAIQPGGTSNAMRALAIGLFCLAAGCGPTQSNAVLMDAAALLAGAEQAKSEERAPYETEAARAYIEKAREEQSRSDYQEAVALGEKARACAQAALDRAEGRPVRACHPRAQAAPPAARTSTSGPESPR